MRARRTESALRPCVLPAIAATLWLATAIAAPMLQAGGHAFPALLARAAFSPICHQNPGRSFWIDGAPMALCARCTGLAVGFLLGCLWLSARLASGAARPSPPPGRAVLLAAAPALFEFGLERSGLWAGSAWARALTGMPPAFIVALYAVAAARELPAEISAEIPCVLRFTRKKRMHAGTC